MEGGLFHLRNSAGLGLVQWFLVEMLVLMK